ncbi:MAG: hypothetical protein R3D27_03180 [Hyphomicrobiaceae bacterium]
MIRKKHLALTLLAAAAVVVAALALKPRLAGGEGDKPKAEDNTWRTILTQQLMGERQCKLDHIVAVRRFQLAGSEAVEGRVRCSDGREFDFSRAKVHLKFELRLCQPAVC